MAKKAYIGIDGKARQVKKLYVGVDGKARSVVKAYVGVGGVARQWWPSELKYYGKATSLSVARTGMAAANIGGYALFAGGSDANSSVNTVDAYDSSLTRSNPESLVAARYPTGTKVGNSHALFAGGIVNYAYTGKVDAYDSSLTRSNAQDLSYANSGYDVAGASVGDYGLFGGGGTASSSYSDTVNAYNSSLTRTICTPLNEARYGIETTSVGNYALFIGGYSERMTSDRVEAYNKYLTYSHVMNCAFTGHSDTGGARGQVGSYGLLCPSNGGNRVLCFDPSLTLTYLQFPFYFTVLWPTATEAGDYLVFAAECSSVLHIVAYDSSLTLSELDSPAPYADLNHFEAAETTGNYAIFAGGASNSDIRLDTVYVYAG